MRYNNDRCTSTGEARQAMWPARGKRAGGIGESWIQGGDETPISKIPWLSGGIGLIPLPEQPLGPLGSILTRIFHELSAPIFKASEL